MRKKSFYIRKFSFFSPNKKGIVLPIVMVFMLLSQTLYWSMLHLNQINSQQYQQFQAYYQTEIQHSIVDHLLASDDASLVLVLEEQIIKQMLNQHHLMIHSLAVDDFLLELPQVGLAQLSANNYSERVLLYKQQLFLDHSRLDFCPLFQSLECFGQLNANGTYDPISLSFPTEKKDLFENLQSHLITEGFVLNRQLKRNYIDQLVDNSFDGLNFTFNTGDVFIQQINPSTYQISSQLNHVTFQVKQAKPIPITRYLLIWQGEIYERLIEN